MMIFYIAILCFLLPHLCITATSSRIHVAALVIARGGSKGIPMKNLATVGGQSLLHRTLLVINQGTLFDSVWVSTDHMLIALEAIKGNSSVHRRHKLSATDQASSVFAVQEFLHEKKEVDIVALVQCTSPFLKHSYLESALKKILDKDCVFAVNRSYKLRWDPKIGNLHAINFDPKRRPRRQDWDGEFVETGAFYFARRKLVESGHFQNNNCSIVEVPALNSLEVDTEYDLKVANILSNVFML